MSPTDETAPRKIAPSSPSSGERLDDESAPAEHESAETPAEHESAEAPASDGSSESVSVATESGSVSEEAGRPADQAPSREPSVPSVPSVEEEIVLGEGKTLSDYLEDEPPPAPGAAPAQDPDAYRSVANVEKMIVPPPAGVRHREAGEPDAQSEGSRGSGADPGKRPRRGGDRTQAGGADRPAPPRPPKVRDAASAALPRAGRPVERASSETPGDGEDFQAMLESSLQARSFDEGETVRGRIVAIGPDVAFLDIGGKSEATIGLEELKDPEGDLEVEVGDTIEAIVVSTEGGLKLSRKLALGGAAKEQIADAFRSGLPVEGRVEKTIKGGYEVRIAGQRAFCPFSQIDTVRAGEPSVHEGRVYTFRIIEFKEGGRNLVVSRRVLLKDEEKQKAEETRKSIVPGAVLKGRVVSVREYGAFVDLGGVQGLVHVSEMGWTRVAAPAEVVKPGDEVEVKVLKVDEEKGKISLGMKQLMADPWSKVAETYKIGEVRQGKIVRIQDFGAFVELEPGIEALAHSSTFAPTGTTDGWKKASPPGTSGEFEILTIDPARKRIGVAYLGDGSWRARAQTDAADAPEGRAEAGPGRNAQAGRAARSAAGAPRRTEVRAGDRITGKIERHESFGVFVYLGPGRTGLLPAAESGTQRGSDLKKAFPVGSELEVLVLEVDPAGRKIRLSRKALLDNEEKADAREFASRQQLKESFGSIGDKLRAALAARQK